jgi:hypothetical protein
MVGDEASAEGYHDLTFHKQPVSKVFVKASLADDVPVSVTASHELFEMVIDPIANLWAQKTQRTQFAYEMCDPVEEDTFMVNGIQMSNFVHPSWFEPFKHPRGTKFDHLGLLTKPFSMTKGGYMIIKKNGRVSEKFGSPAKAKRFAKEIAAVIAASFASRAGSTSARRRSEKPGRRAKGASRPAAASKRANKTTGLSPGGFCRDAKRSALRLLGFLLLGSFLRGFLDSLLGRFFRR